MAYLEKTIENVYGDNANCFVITKAEVTPQWWGIHIATWNLSLFKDAPSIWVKQFSDNFKFNYELTQEDVDWNTTLVLYNKIIESVLDEDDNETNLLNGNVWQIGFQDAVIKE